MATRLNDFIACGELLNTRKNSVHGWLGLKGTSRPVILSLTGNCEPDLAGRHIRFCTREEREQELAAERAGDAADVEPEAASEEAPTGLERFAWEQIGPTGLMTAARNVRVTDCPPEELYRRCRLGEPPPTEWKRCLYLEWYSQNGRVVLEIPDPYIEFVEGEPSEPPPPEVEHEQAGGPDITEVRLDEDGKADVVDFGPQATEDEEDGGRWGGIPDDLQRELDAQTRELDRAIRGCAGEPDEIAELERMDRLIEGGEKVPIGSLFEEALQLPSPDGLGEEQAEAALKVLLARLALHGVAIDQCEHYTALDTYRWLVRDLCVKEGAFPQLRGTGWVQHFSTWESCQACDAEAEARFREYPRPPEEPGSDEAGPAADDDPFL